MWNAFLEVLTVFGILTLGMIVASLTIYVIAGLLFWLSDRLEPFDRDPGRRKERA